MRQSPVLKTATRSSKLSDIDDMVALSSTKRLAYEKAQPRFWRHNAERGDYSQTQWLKELLNAKDHLMFTAEDEDQEEDQEVLGFVIGRLMPAPAVYDPGGLTLMIDDFCVQSENLWGSVGAQLMQATQVHAKTEDVAQILVVCGAHDHPKRLFLISHNLSIASEWFVGGMV